MHEIYTGTERQTDRQRQTETDRETETEKETGTERESTSRFGQLLDRTPCQAHSVTGQEKYDQVTEGSGDDRASRKGQKWNR